MNLFNISHGFNAGQNLTPIINCSVTTTQSAALNVLPMSIYFVVTCVNLFNLLIFRLWRNKQPYLIFHQVLAVASLGHGSTACIILLIRILAVTVWGPKSQLAMMFWSSVSGCCHFVAVIVTVLISLDRWMSVEFLVWYRNTVSRGKIIGACVSCWGLSIAVVVWYLTQGGRGLSCRGPTVYTSRRPWQTVLSDLISGPILILILLLSQLRILAIVVQKKVRLHHTSRVLDYPVQCPRGTVQTVTRAVRQTLFASMTVVLGTVLALIPGTLVKLVKLNDVSVSETLQQAANLMTSIQHLQSMAIYAIFFPEFRVAIRGLFPCLLGRPGVRQRSNSKSSSKVAPTAPLSDL